MDHADQCPHDRTRWRGQTVASRVDATCRPTRLLLDPVVSTRVVSTTTVPLFQRVTAGRFLDVLYYRLNTVLLDGTHTRRHVVHSTPTEETDGVTAAIVRRVLDQGQPPAAVSPQGVKTLVIRDVDTLSAEQQRDLLSWLEQATVVSTRVVSTTTGPALSACDCGSFPRCVVLPPEHSAVGWNPHPCHRRRCRLATSTTGAGTPPRAAVLPGGDEPPSPRASRRWPGRAAIIRRLGGWFETIALVEAAGVEPASEGTSPKDSTCVSASDVSCPT